MWKLAVLLLQLALTVITSLKERGAATDAQKVLLADLLRKAADDLALASKVRSDVDAIPDGELRDAPGGFWRD